MADVAKVDVARALRDERIIAILRGDFTPQEVLRLAQVLIDHGIRAIEYTWNSPSAAAVVGSLRDHFGSRVLLGAGTLLTVDHFREACRAGADYFICPHWSPALSDAASADGRLLLPGVFTPTEVHAAYERGWRLQKIFPAHVGGPAHVKALRGPFADVDFVPTGGVDPDNAGAYITAGAAAVGVGARLTHPGIDPDVLAGRADALVRAVGRDVPAEGRRA